MAREIKYRINGDQVVGPYTVSQPGVVQGLTNDVATKIELQIIDDGVESHWSNPVTVTPHATLEVDPFAVPGPTILSHSQSGSNVTLTYHAEDLSDKVDLPGVSHGIWDHDYGWFEGDEMLGSSDHGKCDYSASRLNRVIGQGLPVSVRLSVGTSGWQNYFQSRASAILANAGAIRNIILMDEPGGWTNQQMHDMIEVAKGVLGEDHIYTITTKQNNANGWGSPIPLSQNLRMVQLNYYPIRDDSVHTEGRIKATNTGWGLPACLVGMANQFEDANIDPEVCSIGVTGQAFAGVNEPEFVAPPLEFPFWIADVINDWNAGVYDNRGYKVEMLQWYEMRARADGSTTTRDDGIRGLDPAYFRNIKKIDVFDRPAVTVNEVRFTAVDKSNNNETVSVHSNTGQQTLSLSSGKNYRIFIQSIVGGQASAPSNFIEVST